MSETNLFSIDISGRTGHVSAVRRAIRLLGKGEGLTDEATSDLCLAVGEAVTNAVEHGRKDERIQVRAKRNASDVIIYIENHGDFTPPTEIGMPTSDAEHGRGLALIHALADGVSFISESGRTTVCIRKMLTRPQ